MHFLYRVVTLVSSGEPWALKQAWASACSVRLLHLLLHHYCIGFCLWSLRICNSWRHWRKDGMGWDRAVLLLHCSLATYCMGIVLCCAVLYYDLRYAMYVSRYSVPYCTYWIVWMDGWMEGREERWEVDYGGTEY
jgi:hypothetical protein